MEEEQRGKYLGMELPNLQGFTHPELFQPPPLGFLWWPHDKCVIDQLDT